MFSCEPFTGTTTCFSGTSATDGAILHQNNILALCLRQDKDVVSSRGIPLEGGISCDL
jgi:hypothetical protein